MALPVRLSSIKVSARVLILILMLKFGPFMGLAVPLIGVCYTYDDVIFHPGFIDFPADQVRLE